MRAARAAGTPSRRGIVERFERSGIRLVYERHGATGDPLVLVHGGWDDRAAWAGVLPGLAGSFEVLAYDRRGHGASQGPARPHPVRDDAGDLAALLEHTGQFPAHLVAEGHGGGVAFRLAVDRPELVRSVAVHEPTYVGLLEGTRSGGPTASTRQARLRALANGGSLIAAAEGYVALFGAPGEQWSRLQEHQRDRLLANASAWGDEAGDPEADGPPDGIREVLVPTLLTYGASSSGLCRQVGARLGELLPNGATVGLRDGGHFIRSNDPDVVVGVLGTFLLERNVPST